MRTTQHPFTTRRVVALAAAGLVAFGMSGCALLTPAHEEVALTPLETCALGKTWTLDTTDIAEQILADFESRGYEKSEVAVDGSQTFTWSLEGDVSVQSDYTLTLTTKAENKTLDLVETHSGTSTGRAFINSEVAIPRNWDTSGLDIGYDVQVSKKDVEPSEIPISIPNIDIDDSVGLELTCDGGTMTTHGRGSELTLTWTS